MKQKIVSVFGGGLEYMGKATNPNPKAVDQKVPIL